MTRDITLFIPGIALPGQLLRDLSFDLPVSGLRGLLAAGRLTDLPPAAKDSGTLFAACTHPAHIPAAGALRRVGLGGRADDAHWLCVDPIHLGFQERSIVVQNPALMQLSIDEARDIAVSLAPTLDVFGELSVDDPLRWHMRLRQPAPEFTPLDAALSARAALGLCTDKAWQIALNEVQMILHRHPVNDHRTKLGLPAINSVWPWGGGRLLPPATQAVRKPCVMVSDNPCLRGLAMLHGQRAERLPNGFPALATHNSETTLVVLDALDAPANSGNAQSWRDGLLAMDEHWFAPLLNLWQTQKSMTIHLVFPYQTTAHHLLITPARLASGLREALAGLRRKFGVPDPGSSLDDLAQ